MQVSSLSDSCACHGDGRSGQSRVQTRRLAVTLIGGILIANSFIVRMCMEGGEVVGSIYAVAGAIILIIPIIYAAIRDILKGTLYMNELVAVAVLATCVQGQYTTAGIISFFMLIANIIESQTARGAVASIESLIKITPSKARLIVNDIETEVVAQDLKLDDMIRVRPGDSIPADGIIVRGASSINEATITGESLPVDKEVEAEVFAGTHNLTGALDVRVTRIGRDTTLGRVKELILEAEQTKLPFMRLIDKYVGYYTPIMLCLAALVWLFTKDMNRVIAVLIVSCPCALILATPSAIVSALSAASRLGILVKNVSDLELASRINVFVFDKTGTLTKGILAVSRLAPVEGVAPSHLLKIAASAELFSNHPAAKALVALAKEAGVELTEPVDFKEQAGHGIEAYLGEDKVVVGRQAWLKTHSVHKIDISSVDLEEAQGYSVVFVAQDKRFLGWIGFEDEVRGEARSVVEQLGDLSVKKVSMFTGDRESVAARVAHQIGSDEYEASCFPEDKVAYIRKIKEEGYLTAVVGDGVNDAPALAEGDIGIAMGTRGSEVAIHSATIALMTNNLSRIPSLVRLSRKMKVLIHENFLVGLAIILGGLTLSGFGLLSGIVAAIIHNVGLLVVVFNSARLIRFGEEIQ